MQKKFLFSASLFIIVFSAIVNAQHPKYVKDTIIALPGDGSYDYLTIDESSSRLYVTHGSSVHVVDLKTNRALGLAGGMQGNHGVAIAPGTGKAFVSDGKADAVIVFDLATMQILTRIPLTGKKPDAILYDPLSKYIFAFNGNSSNASVIDVSGMKEISLIPLGGAPEFAVSDGHGKIYNNLEDKNSIAIIDTKKLSVEDHIPLSPCGGPTGLAYDSIHNLLFSVCRENKGMTVVDAVNRKLITTVPIGSGVDAVAYDAESKLIVCSNGDGTVTVIFQKSPKEYEVIQTLTTQLRAKTLALDHKTHKIYLSAVDFESGTKNPVPGSFKVLVYKLTD